MSRGVRRVSLMLSLCVVVSSSGVVLATNANATTLSPAYCALLANAAHSGLGELQGERGVAAVRLAIAWDVKTYSGLASHAPTARIAQDYRKVVAAYKELSTSTPTMKWIVSNFNGPIPAAYSKFVLTDTIYDKTEVLLVTCPLQIQ